MAEMTIAQARNGFSSIVADLVSGREKEHVIKKRGVVVARIVPAGQPEEKKRVFGAYKDDPMLIDDDLFDTLDGEIAEEFGV